MAGVAHRPGQLQEVGCAGTFSALYFSELMVTHAQGLNSPKSLQVPQAKNKCSKEMFDTQN